MEARRERDRRERARDGRVTERGGGGGGGRKSEDDER